MTAPLVTTDWLAAHLRDADLRILDATWHMPQLKRDARAEGRPVESGTPSPSPKRFTAKLRPELVRALSQIRDNLATRRDQVVDARSYGRFVGTEPEPRAGLRGGHIPGSINVPYDQLYR